MLRREISLRSCGTCPRRKIWEGAPENTRFRRSALPCARVFFKLPNLPDDGASGLPLRRLPQHATRRIHSSRRNTNQEARQIVTFCEASASA
jgi:hypothetical protein